MARLKLQPDPTFKAKVGIPVPGAPAAEVEFTFKYRDRQALQAFIEASDGREDVDTLMEMCTGWELVDPFNRESLDLLVGNYISAPRAIFERYIEEHTKVRQKN